MLGHDLLLIPTSHILTYVGNGFQADERTPSLTPLRQQSLACLLLWIHLAAWFNTATDPSWSYHSWGFSEGNHRFVPSLKTEFVGNPGHSLFLPCPRPYSPLALDIEFILIVLVWIVNVAETSSTVWTHDLLYLPASGLLCTSYTVLSLRYLRSSVSLEFRWGCGRCNSVTTVS